MVARASSWAVTHRLRAATSVPDKRTGVVLPNPNRRLESTTSQARLRSCSVGRMSEANGAQQAAARPGKGSEQSRNVPQNQENSFLTSLSRIRPDWKRLISKAGMPGGRRQDPSLRHPDPMKIPNWKLPVDRNRLDRCGPALKKTAKGSDEAVTRLGINDLTQKTNPNEAKNEELSPLDLNRVLERTQKRSP